MPTVIEIAVYAFLALFTLAVSNIEAINNFLLIPADFSFKTAILGSLEDLLAQLVGERAAATLITGLFWGLIGMLVYLFLWLFSNFSTEFSNDLAMSKFMHPKGVDRFSALKGLVFRLIFQICIGILFVVYLNMLITVFLPLWSTRYNNGVDAWPDLAAIGGLILTLLSEVLAFHILTVLLRLLLLRKRLFFYSD